MKLIPCAVILLILVITGGCVYNIQKNACPTARTEYERLAWAYKECKEDPGCFTTINDLQKVDLARSRVQTVCSAERVDKRE